MRTYNRSVSAKMATGSKTAKPDANRALVRQLASQPAETLNTAPAPSFIGQALHYQLDRWQRSVLF